MIGHSIGATIMLQLGSYQFSVNAAAYQELRRRTDYNWASQDRFGKAPALQFTGFGADEIQLSGVIYTEFRGGLNQINAMRDEAGQGQPLMLIDGDGRLHGTWVIKNIEEGQTVFASAGRPRKQEFSLTLQKREL